jgi:hypothetical protein
VSSISNWSAIRCGTAVGFSTRMNTPNQISSAGRFVVTPGGSPRKNSKSCGSVGLSWREIWTWYFISPRSR